MNAPTPHMWSKRLEAWLQGLDDADRRDSIATLLDDIEDVCDDLWQLVTAPSKTATADGLQTKAKNCTAVIRELLELE